METIKAIEEDQSSDYGPGFTSEEETILHDLLAAKSPKSKPKIAPSLPNQFMEHGACYARLSPKIEGSSVLEVRAVPESEGSSDLWPLDDNNTQNEPETPKSRNRRKHLHIDNAVPLEQGDEQIDSRSPLERFRTPPMKALSVTDLISPSWCELQYWFTLSRHGKKRTTPAMRQGSAVHKTLEDQVHRTVEISVTSKEDAFALRILNTIQGARALRENGLTREFEVWGLVEGQIVNGVIDELSAICPDQGLEADSSSCLQRSDHERDQTKLTDLLDTGDSVPSTLRTLRSMQKRSSKVYIADIKTRGHRSIPKGAAFRPTLYQLMLYRRLLSDLADNKVDFDLIAARFGLDSAAGFSDSFIAQIGGLYEAAPQDISLSPETRSDFPLNPCLMDSLLEHTSLRKLWNHLMTELSLALPNGSKAIGKVLRVEYRDRNDSSILGIKTFLYDEDILDSYIASEMKWWRGERAAEGVCIEEAYKCRSCDFQEGCEWRLSKIEESTQMYRNRHKGSM